MAGGQRRPGLLQHGEALGDPARGHQRPTEREPGLDPAVVVVDRVEGRQRLAGPLDSRLGAPRPQADAGGEHLAHAQRPAIAGLAGRTEDLLGHGLRLVRIARVEAGEGQQAHGPAQPRPIAEIGEESRRVVQERLGVVDAAGDEVGPRQVLQRPGPPEAVVQRGVDHESRFERRDRRLGVVAQQGGEATHP